MRLLPPSAGPETRLLLSARALRAAADGFISIVLPAYLLLLGLDPLTIGIVATATLLGSAAVTLGVGLAAARLEPRRTLLAAAMLMALTGIAFASSSSFWPLLVVAFVGTLNPSAGDVSLFLPLEQSLLTHGVAADERTALFARYSLIGAGCGAFGTLLAGLPDLAPAWGIDGLVALRALFVLYAVVGLAVWLIYRQLPTMPSDRSGRRHRSAHRAGSSTGWPRCSASTRSQAGWSSSPCWRCGCSRPSACRWRRRPGCSSGPGC